MYYSPAENVKFFSNEEIRNYFNHISLPEIITEQFLESIGVFPLTAVSPTTDFTKIATEATPIEVSGRWMQSWNITDATKELVLSRKEAEELKCRAKRDCLLAETDWLVIREAEGIPMSAEQKTYRQALRDISTQAGFPFSIEWPIKPE